MASFSNITIFGHLGRKPTEVKVTQTGTPVTDFSVAVSTKRGNGEENTTWYMVRVFGKSAQPSFDYLDKGSPVLVSGRHQIREYVDRDGNKRSANEVFANEVVFVERKDAARTATAGTDDPVDSDIPF